MLAHELTSRNVGFSELFTSYIGPPTTAFLLLPFSQWSFDEAVTLYRVLFSVVPKKLRRACPLPRGGEKLASWQASEPSDVREGVAEALALQIFRVEIEHPHRRVLERQPFPMLRQSPEATAQTGGRAAAVQRVSTPCARAVAHANSGTEQRAARQAPTALAADSRRSRDGKEPANIATNPPSPCRRRPIATRCSRRAPRNQPRLPACRAFEIRDCCRSPIPCASRGQ